MKEDIRKAAKILIEAGFCLCVCDQEEGSHVHLSTPEEVAEYVAELERQGKEGPG